MHLVRTIIAISSGILLAVTLRSPIGIARAGKIIEAGGRLKFRSSRRTYRRVIEFDAQLCGVTGASNAYGGIIGRRKKETKNVVRRWTR